MATLKKNGVALTATDKSDVIAGLGLSSVVTIDPETGAAGLNPDAVADANNREVLYVDLCPTFGKSGYGTPSGLTNYPSINDAGSYELSGVLVTGDVGATTITLNTGTVADLSGIWSGAIEYPDGIWRTHTVKNASGTTLDVFPPLEASVYRVKLVNVQDSATGQHLTGAGSFALADYLFDFNAKFAKRDHYHYRIDVTDTSGWSLYGGLSAGRLAHNTAGNSYTHYAKATQFVRYITRAVIVACNTNQGCSKIWDISGKSGYFETFVTSGDASVPARVDVLIDGYVVYRKDIFGIETIRIPFAGSASLECRIYSLSLQTGSTYIGRTTLWDSASDVSNGVFSKGDRVVWLGDSWTYRQAGAITRRLQRRGEQIGLTVIPIGKPGEQATWAISNFDKVSAASPTVVVIEYFVNDFNALTEAGYSTWKERIDTLVSMVASIGARPVVLTGSPTGSESQAQGICNWSSKLTAGVQR